MEPKKYYNLKETELFDSDNFLTEGEDDEEENSSSQEQSRRVTPEQIRIDSLKLALKIIKMFDKVTAEDLLNVSSQVSSYLINHQAGSEYEPDDIKLSADNDESAENEEGDADESNIDEDNINLDDMEDFNIEDDEEENAQPSEDNEETNEFSNSLPDEFTI